MTLRNYYWYFTSALTPRFCDEVIKQGLGKQETIATTGQFGNDRDLEKNPLTKEEIKLLKCKRDSNVTWMGDPWIYKEIHPYIRRANKSAGGLNLANSLSTSITSFMVGIQIVGKNLTKQVR
jgi:hypothetical protein